MMHTALRLAHVIGVILLGAGLIGVWVSDMRSRQVRDLSAFSEAVRNIAVFYDGLVVPGALILLASGTWLIVEFFGGWSFVRVPWLASMVYLFVFEFIEGNTVGPIDSNAQADKRVLPSAVSRVAITPCTATRSVLRAIGSCRQVSCLLSMPMHGDTRRRRFD